MSSEVNQLNGSAIPVHDESHCVEKLVEARLVLPPMVVAAATSFLVSWPTRRGRSDRCGGSAAAWLVCQ